MKNFLVVSNKEKDPENKVAGSIKEYLDVRECICSCRCVTHDNVSRDELEKAVDEGAECVLVLGGDGTLIQVAGALAGKDIPLLGINLGTLGYLAEVDTDTRKSYRGQIRCRRAYDAERRDQGHKAGSVK